MEIYIALDFTSLKVDSCGMASKLIGLGILILAVDCVNNAM